MSVTDLTAGELITKFELQVDDLTELSSQEELDLLNDKMLDVAMERPWEALKTPVEGTSFSLDATNGLYYLAVPTDFSNFVENNMYTDNTLPVENNAAPKVVFVGQGRQPFQIVNYSDRMQYRTQSGVCYLDLVAQKIYFTVAPNDMSYYQYDYLKVPPILTSAASIPSWIPNRFRKMLYFAMATDNEIIQLSSKANSYAADNRAKYQDTLDKMAFWNANLINY